MSDFDDRLTRDLHDRAEQIELPDPGPERIMRRGEHRRRRARTLAVASTLALVAGTVAAARSIDSNRARHGTKVIVSADPDGSSLPDLGSSLPGASRLGDVPPADVAASTRQWKTSFVPFGKGLGFVIGGAVQRGGDTLVAASTLPGVNTDDSKLALYSSNDGITWSASALDQSHWFTNFGGSGNTLLGFGTAPGVASAGANALQRLDARLSRSTDGGKSWKDVKLPVELASFESKLPADVGLDVRTAMASGPKQTLVAVQTMLYGDLGKLVPADVEARWGTRVASNGIEVIARPDELTAKYVECTSGVAPPDASCNEVLDKARAITTVADRDRTVGRVITWAELGYTQDEAALAGGGLKMFASSDGTTFAPVPVPSIGQFISRPQLVAIGDGFAIGAPEADTSGSGAPHYAVYRTDDLSTWTASEPLSLQLTSPSPLAVVGDRVAMVGQGDRGETVVAVSDGTKWQLSDLSPGLAKIAGLDPSTTSFPQLTATGPGGIAIVANVNYNPMSAVDVTMQDRGYTLRAQGSTGLVSVSEDATGKVVAKASDLLNLSDHSSALKLLNADGSESTFSNVPTTVSGLVPPATVPGVQYPLAPTATFATVPITSANEARAPVTTIGATVSAAGPVAAPTTGAADGVVLCRPIGGSTTACDVANGSSLGPSAMADTPEAPVTAVLVDPASDKELARFSLAELQQAVRSATSQPLPNGARGQYLLHSRDGVSWTADDLVTASGDQLTYVSSVVVTGDQVVVTGSTQIPDPSVPSNNGYPFLKQIAMVASI